MPQTHIKSIPFQHRGSLVARFFKTLTEAIARRRERRSLRHLDAHLLRDIGLDPTEAKSECAKPFWRS